MRLYHFLPACWALDDLEKRRIKIARLDDLNDPFEFMCYQHPAPEVREWFRASKREIAKKQGVVCFSRTWKNPLLWSHYADRHKGICLGFDVPDEAPDANGRMRSLAFPVEYTAERPQLEGRIQLNTRFIHQWLSTKYEGWRYEDEVRVFTNLDEEIDGLFYHDFGPKLKVKQVIVGPLCTKRAELRPFRRMYEGGLEFIKARLAFQSFDVVPDKRGLW